MALKNIFGQNKRPEYEEFLTNIKSYVVFLDDGTHKIPQHVIELK